MILQKIKLIYKKVNFLTHFATTLGSPCLHVVVTLLLLWGHFDRLLHKNAKSKKFIFLRGISKELPFCRPRGGKPDAADSNQEVLKSHSSSEIKTTKNTCAFKKSNFVKIDTDHSMQNDITKTVLVLIWSETYPNNHFKTKLIKSSKKHMRAGKKSKNLNKNTCIASKIMINIAVQDAVLCDRCRSLCRVTLNVRVHRLRALHSARCLENKLPPWFKLFCQRECTEESYLSRRRLYLPTHEKRNTRCKDTATR